MHGSVEINFIYIQSSFVTMILLKGILMCTMVMAIFIKLYKASCRVENPKNYYKSWGNIHLLFLTMLWTFLISKMHKNFQYKLSMYNYRFIDKKQDTVWGTNSCVFESGFWSVFFCSFHTFFCHKCKQTFLRKEEKIIDFYLLYFRPSIFLSLWG